MNSLPSLSRTTLVNTEEWSSEKLFFDAPSFEKSLIEDLKKANASIDIESYIFEPGKFLDQITEILIQKRKEGVRVRVLSDGFGSYFYNPTFFQRFAGTNVEFKEFHPLPFRLLSFKYIHRFKWFELPEKYLLFLMRMNRRNHRKTIVIDREIAWVGSKNIHDKAWRETIARVIGPSVKRISRIFGATWLTIGARRIFRWPKPNTGPYWTSSNIRFNSTRKIRRFYNSLFLKQIRCARKRIWVTNPYFVPTIQMMRALVQSAKKGIDVRILLPLKSDVPGILWVTRLYYEALLHAKIKVFEYTAEILHAKTTLIDNELWVGTSNLNHRSFLHDLEIDVKLTKPKTILDYEKQFGEDIKNAIAVDRKYKKIPNWIGRILLYPFYLLRHWI